MAQGQSFLGITDIRVDGCGPQLILGKKRKVVKWNLSLFEAVSHSRGTCPELALKRQMKIHHEMDIITSLKPL